MQPCDDRKVGDREKCENQLNDKEKEIETHVSRWCPVCSLMRFFLDAWRQQERLAGIYIEAKAVSHSFTGRRAHTTCMLPIPFVTSDTSRRYSPSEPASPHHSRRGGPSCSSVPSSYASTVLKVLKQTGNPVGMLRDMVLGEEELERREDGPVVPRLSGVGLGAQAAVDHTVAHLQPRHLRGKAHLGRQTRRGHD